MNTEKNLLVAVDVDGTLLNTEFDHVLRPREIAALEAVRQAGHVLALCTGRNTHSVQSLLDKSGWNPVDMPLVLLNGALVWVGQPRRRLVYNVLDGDLIRQLIPIFRDHGTVPLVYASEDDGGAVFHESRPVNDVLGRYLAMRGQFKGSLDRVDDLLEIPWKHALEVGTIDEKERIEALTRGIHAKLDGRVNVINTRSLLGKGRYFWAEVYRFGSDKGHGLSALARELDFTPDRVVAIGDNFNDLAMFDFAGCSVAMGNSPDEVKRRAHRLAAHVDKSGAAEILESIAAGEFHRGGLSQS